MAKGTCTVEGCDNPHLARGWCSKHYHRNYHGRALRSGWSDLSVLERLALKSVQDGACLVWTGDRSLGYGVIKLAGKRIRTHRAAWTARNGPIPEGMEICHRCDNPPCWAEDHLFIGTHTDNVRDMVSKGRHFESRKTHCKSGHPLSGDNLQVEVKPDGSTARRCRTCRRAAQRAKRRGAV